MYGGSTEEAEIHTKMGHFHAYTLLRNWPCFF